jgi:hypothetical protein
MTATIHPERWLEFLRTEYLESFIKDGGASVKFAVPLDDHVREDIAGAILVQAKNAGYIVARVSSAETRVHLIDQLFFRVADQIPWRQLSEDVVTKLAREAHYVVPSVQSPEPFVNRLAKANSRDPEVVAMEAKRWIDRGVFRQPLLAKDFRVAVTQLCLAELSGGPDGETTVQVITGWLTGRNKAISAVKPYNIFRRVNRSNARHLFESLLFWVRFAGYPGLIILLDLSRVTIARNPHDDLVFYSKAAMFDAYEVLRQFIDATSTMKGCLILVMPTLEFLDVEPFGRGMGAYDALKLRVYDEIRDQRLVNPMAALVRLSPETDLV